MVLFALGVGAAIMASHPTFTSAPVPYPVSAEDSGHSGLGWIIDAPSSEPCFFRKDHFSAFRPKLDGATAPVKHGEPRSGSSDFHLVYAVPNGTIIVYRTTERYDGWFGFGSDSTTWRLALDPHDLTLEQLFLPDAHVHLPRDRSISRITYSIDHHAVLRIDLYPESSRIKRIDWERPHPTRA